VQGEQRSPLLEQSPSRPQQALLGRYRLGLRGVLLLVLPVLPVLLGFPHEGPQTTHSNWRQRTQSVVIIIVLDIARPTSCKVEKLKARTYVSGEPAGLTVFDLLADPPSGVRVVRDINNVSNLEGQLVALFGIVVVMHNVKIRC
jgi:hypothetical protein